MIVTPKINIGLRVLGKREDGFHELETVFYPVSNFSDTLEIVEAPSLRFEIVGPMVDWDPEKDLVAKAYRLLKESFDLPPVCIHVEKGIPVGAGMGGGSADGAAALVCLNNMFSLGLSKEQLEAFAARLGSDCPFFVKGRPCIATGRGEIMKPIDLNLDEWEIRIEKPEGEKVGTAEAYGNLHRGPLSEARKYDQSLEQIVLGTDVRDWKDLVFNDFEQSVFPGHPAIAELKNQFYSDGAIYASMTGSGAAVFGLFKK